MRLGQLVFGVAAVIPVFALAACGSNTSAPATVTVTASSAQESAATNSTAPSESAAPTKLSGLQEYASAQALADDLTKYGHTCNFTPTTGAQNAVDSGNCYVNGTQMILGIYADQSKIDAQITFVEDVLGNNNVDYGMLAGKNWTINCGSRAACEDIQADLGGR
ncbi:MAG: hypothetical protein WBN99_14770 [Mycobacterium sp.]